MDIGKAFSYVFEDERWVSKILLGGLIAVVPILNFAVIGYMMQIAQNVAQGNPRPLPEWTNLGDYFMRGLYGVVIAIVYFVPVMILYVVAFGILAAAGAASDNGGGEVVGLLGLCLMPLSFLVAIACGLGAYAGMARFVVTNNLSEAFKFNEVISLVRNNSSLWLMLILVYILAGIVAPLGLIACGIGAMFTAFYAQCVNGHAFGQLIAQVYRSQAYAPATPPTYTPPTTYQ